LIDKNNRLDTDDYPNYFIQNQNNTKMKRKIFFTMLFLSVIAYPLIADEFELRSPDGNSMIKIDVGHQITHSIFYKRKPVILESPFSLEFSQAAPFKEDFMVEEKQTEEVNEDWQPLYGKHSVIHNHYNELTLTLREERFPGRTLIMVYRAYNEGIAIRYEIPASFPKLLGELKNENTIFRFGGNHTVWGTVYQSFTTGQEEEYDQKKLSDIKPGDIIGMPLLVEVDNTCYVAITDANLFDWAGMYITGDTPGETGENVIRTVFSPIPDASYWGGYDKPIAHLVFPATSPWRVVMMHERPEKLLESEILMNLSNPSVIENTDWIRPGKVAWDGWWALDDKSTELLKEYIDFAAYMGIPYQLVDGGWSKPNTILEWNENVDLGELLEYAKQKNVKLWVWAHYRDIDKQYKEAFPLYEKWGIVGVKIDFMSRDDQEMVNWYHKIAESAAKHHLMLNFHGAYKPTGDQRTYPNMMTREAVLGSEYNKWSDKATPEHNVTLAYTRNLLGSMDYTPGGFINRAKGEFKTNLHVTQKRNIEGKIEIEKNVQSTQVMGTRCHQLAMYVVYDSPVAFLSDYPGNYYGEPGLDFLKVVPTVSDDIIGINGEVGKYITVAKRSGDDWFIGSLNNSIPREFTINLDFLDQGSYEAVIFRDTEESNVDAEKLESVTQKVKKGDNLTIYMASGGGYVTHIKKLD